MKPSLSFSLRGKFEGEVLSRGPTDHSYLNLTAQLTTDTAITLTESVDPKLRTDPKRVTDGTTRTNEFPRFELKRVGSFVCGHSPILILISGYCSNQEVNYFSRKHYESNRY